MGYFVTGLSWLLNQQISAHYWHILLPDTPLPSLIIILHCIVGPEGELIQLRSSINWLRLASQSTPTLDLATSITVASHLAAHVA